MTMKFGGTQKCPTKRLIHAQIKNVAEKPVINAVVQRSSDPAALLHLLVQKVPSLRVSHLPL